MSQDNPDVPPVDQTVDDTVLPPTPPTSPEAEDKVEEIPPPEPPPETLTPPATPEEIPRKKSPTRPIGPMPNLNKIMKDSLEVIVGVTTQLDRQKHFLASSAYLVYLLQNHMDEYKEHISRTNRFLVANDRLQERWYQTYSQILPTYGDYNLVLKDKPEKIPVEGLPLPIAEGKLKEFVSDVFFNLYGGGQQVKFQRVMNSKINKKMDERRDMSGNDFFHYERWMNLLTGEIDNENTLLSNCFEFTTYIDFLTLGMKN